MADDPGLEPSRDGPASVRAPRRTARSSAHRVCPAGVDKNGGVWSGEAGGRRASQVERYTPRTVTLRPRPAAQLSLVWFSGGVDGRPLVRDSRPWASGAADGAVPSRLAISGLRWTDHERRNNPPTALARVSGARLVVGNGA